MGEYIEVKNARVNNLKGISLKIPRDKLIVISGVSGSGKSSLAFDTLYAEGQRRYVESLSSYARQFLGRMSKPECDYIKGLPPAIAIEQKVISRNSRSTVGTSTEIYEYLRLLFARIGRTYSPVSGEEVKCHMVEDVIDYILSHDDGEKFMITAPIHLPEGRTLQRQLQNLLQQGYTRLFLSGERRVERGERRNESGEGRVERGETRVESGETRVESGERGDVVRISDYLEQLTTNTQHPTPNTQLSIIIDRLSVARDKATLSRMTDSLETAFFEGDGLCQITFTDTTNTQYPTPNTHEFSTRFEADGITFERPSDNMFSFNSPQGACPTCEGFGSTIGIDEKLVIPNPSLSVYDGCVQCWKGEKMGMWKQEFLRRAAHFDFPVFTPYHDLSTQQKDWLWHGLPSEASLPKYERVSIDDFFQMVKENQYKIQYRVMMARYRGKTICPTCHGTRLRKEANYVKVGGKSITELVSMPVSELAQWFSALTLTEHEQAIAKRLLTEINTRLQFLLDVGLGYLTLNRPSNTLSGGESQRINLTTSLGSSLVGSLYILDEPSIGLHARDTQQLISVLRKLHQVGNTVIVVEHDEEMMRAADYIIDIGPDAGRHGGEIVFEGENKLLGNYSEDDLRRLYPDSHTIRYLTHQEQIAVPKSRRVWNQRLILKSCFMNNLKGMDVEIPLNVFTCITGVSGSGKSSLVKGILYPSLKRHLGEVCDAPGEYGGLWGDTEAVRHVEFVDQNPIGKSTRSNPATYLKAYDSIRQLFAEQQLSRQMGFTQVYFSFNADGGRCEECKGAGVTTVEMQFMADLELTCEACHGKRFKPEILEVQYKGKNINDVLNMTVNQAIEFFTIEERREGRGERECSKLCNDIVSRLKPLQDVGLGYIKLGQNSSTLSGGENQRVKLAYYLSMEKHDPTLFIFDEPTTGLHFHDIRRLLDAMSKLIDRGHTVLVIEHNLDVIKCADWIIDLGPEGGNQGGSIVAQGTPEHICTEDSSITGHYLKDKL